MTPGAEPRWYRRAEASFKLLGAVVLAYLVLERILGFLVDLSDVTVILVGGILLAYLVLPLVRRLNERLPLWAALTIVYGGGALIIVAGIYLLVPIMIAQAQDLIAALPAMRKVLDTYLSSTHNPIVTHFPPTLRGYANKVPVQLGIELQRLTTSFSAHVVPALVSVVTVGALSIAIPVVSIYMLAESTMMKRFVARMIPAPRREVAMDILSDIDGVIGGFVRGQLIVAAVIGALATVALLVLHVPYAVLIGAWAGIADVVPYVGPFAGAIPATLVALFTNGWPNAVAVMVAFTIINQFEGHVLGPRIVGSTVKVTPLAVIFALLIGAHVFGFLGLLIAVPVAGIIRVLLVRLFPDDDITNAEIRPGLTPKPLTEVDPEATEA
ncbi:MAG TPA: AI-2E family transporter [Candidatus Elarobacter sp.]